MTTGTASTIEFAGNEMKIYGWKPLITSSAATSSWSSFDDEGCSYDTTSATASRVHFQMRELEYKLLANKSRSAYATRTWGPTSTATSSDFIYYNDGIVSDYVCYDYDGIVAQPKTASERLKEIIRTRMTPGIIVHGREEILTPVRKSLQLPNDERERRARETLCRVIGQQRFRDFLQKGFVSAKNSLSGMIYQIFPGHGITCVYQGGKMIERLCVVLPHGYAPTDSVIVRYLLALNNEQKLWDMGIKHGPIKKTAKTRKLDVRPLVEIMQELKKTG